MAPPSDASLPLGCGDVSGRFRSERAGSPFPAMTALYALGSVVSAIEQGGLLDVLEHPNQDRYPGQLIYVVESDEYHSPCTFCDAG